MYNLCLSRLPSTLFPLLQGSAPEHQTCHIRLPLCWQLTACCAHEAIRNLTALIINAMSQDFISQTLPIRYAQPKVLQQELDNILGANNWEQGRVRSCAGYLGQSQSPS